MTNDHDDFEPPHASSPIEHILTELQLYGVHPDQGELDPRPLPEGSVVAGAIADIFDALIGTLQDSRLEPPHRIVLATSQRINSEPSRNDVGDDR